MPLILRRPLSEVRFAPRSLSEPNHETDSIPRCNFRWCSAELRISCSRFNLSGPIGPSAHPDAAHTDSSGFLKSLVADPRYSLKWVRGSDTTAIVDLTGPGSDTQCQQGMDVISRSAHVVSVKAVDPAEPPGST